MNHFLKIAGMVFNINNILLMPNERGNGYKLLFGNKEILMSKQYAELIEDYIRQATKRNDVDICFNDLTPNHQYGFSHKENNSDLPVPETYEEKMKKAKQELAEVQNLSPFKAKERTPKPSELVEMLAEEEKNRNQQYWEAKAKRKENGGNRPISETELNNDVVVDDSVAFIPKTYEESRMARDLSAPNAKIERL